MDPSLKNLTGLYKPDKPVWIRACILYDINVVCTKFGTFNVICAIVPKGWCSPCLSDASLIITDNRNALGEIPLPAGRSVSACLISYLNYGDICCKVSNLSLFVTQFRSRVRRFESSTGILSISVILVSKS